MSDAAVLVQTVVLHNENSLSNQLPSISSEAGIRRKNGLEGILSPDGAYLALIDASHEVLSVVSIAHVGLLQGRAYDACMDATVHRFSVRASPDQKKGTEIDKISEEALEHLLAFCWYPDSSRLVVAASGGSIYVLERSCKVLAAYSPEKRPFPWSIPSSGQVVAMEMPTEDRLLILNRQAVLFSVPFASAVAGEATFTSLKPMNIKAHHGSALAMAFDPRTNELAILGEGSKSKTLSGLSLTVWSAQGPQLKLMHSLGMTVALRKPSESPLPSACLVFSPSSEFLAVASQTQGVFVVNREGKVVDMSGGQDGGQFSVKDMSKVSSSVGWWGRTALAMCDGISGRLALARLPGFTNVLGASGDPTKVSPGSQVFCLNNEGTPGTLLLLEPFPIPSVGDATPPLEPMAMSAHQAAWRLSVMVQRSAEEMVGVHVANKEWSAALEVAHAHRMDCDFVYKSRWESQPVSSLSIAENLRPISDRFWVADVCDSRLAESFEAQRMLIDFGLGETAIYGADSTGSNEGGADHGRWWKQMRLVLLQRRDRLATLSALHKGVFDASAYAAFKGIDLIEAACQFATSGDIPSLVILFQRHPAALGPQLLQILDALPESMDPRLYAQLLPRADGSLALPSPAEDSVRPQDWVESYQTAVQLQQDGVLALMSATEFMILASNGGTVQLPYPEQVAAWFCDRALLIDASAGQLQHAITLLEAASHRGIQGGVPRLLNQARALRTLVTSPGVHLTTSLMRLEEFSGMTPDARLQLLLLSGPDSEDEQKTRESLDSTITSRAGPYCLGLPPEECSQLLKSLLQHQVSIRPGWCAALVRLEIGSRRLFPSQADLVQAVMAGAMDCESLDAWAELLEMLSAVKALLCTPEGSPHDNKAETLVRVESLLDCVHAAQLLSSRGVPVTCKAVMDASQSNSNAVVIQLLQGANRSSRSWSDREWHQMWRDLLSIRVGGLSVLDPSELLAAFVRSLLDNGKVALASSYLGGRDADLPLLPHSVTEQLVVSVASQLLKGATSLDHPDIGQARSILTLAPESKAAQTELRRLAIIPHILSLGPLDLPPLEILSETDPIEILRKVLEAGRPQALYKDLPQIVEFAEIMGIEDFEQKAQLLVATEALSMGDLSTATRHALDLANQRYSPAWRVAATIGMEVGSVCSAGDEAAASARCKLLAFAAARCDPDALPQLLEELAEGERQGLGEDWFASHLVAPPELLLSRALMQAPQVPLPPGAAAKALPSLGDVPLALAMMGSMQPEDLLSALKALLGPQTPHATRQRVLLMGMAGLSLGAALPSVGPHQRKGLLVTPLDELVVMAKAVSGSAAGAGCDELSTLLKAAEDSRAVRSVVPSADPGAFLAGNTHGQRKAVLQQAHIAGQKTAGNVEVLATDGGMKLLDEAISLAQCYKVAEAWEVRLRFIVGLEAAASTKLGLTEVRQLILSQTQYVLSEASTLNHGKDAALQLIRAISLEVWPHLPVTSSPHVALALTVIANGIESLADQPLVCPDPAMRGTDDLGSNLAGRLLPRLRKMCDLLDKAGAALKGLALRTVITPLLMPLLNEVLRHWPSCVNKEDAEGSAEPLPGALLPAEALDTQLTALVSEAQASVFSYVLPGNAVQASKLLKALQAILAPSRGPSASGQGPPSDTQRPASSRVLTALPVSLPHLCLLVKLTSSPVGVHKSSPAALSLEVWSQAVSCVEKVTGGQLRSWMDFIFSDGKQPLPLGAVGKLSAQSLEPEIQLLVLEDSLPRLLQASDTVPQGGKAGTSIGETALRLKQHYHRLRVWHAVQAHGHLDAMTVDLVHMSSSLVNTKQGPELLTDTLVTLMGNGVSVSSLASMTSSAIAAGPVISPRGTTDQEDGVGSLPVLTGVPADVSDALMDALSEALGVCLSQLLDPHGGQEKESLRTLHGIVRSLVSEGGLPFDEDLLGLLRDTSWQLMQDSVDRLDPKAYSRPAVLELMDCMASVVSQQMWPNWVAPNGEGAAESPSGCIGEGPQRLLLGRTLAALGDRWPVESGAVTADDVADTQGASECFSRLLQASTDVQQMRLLGKMLADIWKDGAVWGEKPFQVVDEPWPVSALHGCWMVLGVAFIERGYPLDAVRLMDYIGHAVTQGLHSPLMEKEITVLLDKASALDPDHVSFLMPCLGLISPSSQHRLQAARALEIVQPVHLKEEDHHICLCLVAAALKAGVPNSLCASSVAWKAICLSLSKISPHPSTSSGGPSSDLLGCLLPTVSSGLVLAGKVGWAATLTSSRLRLHPSLTGLGGSVAYLEKFLRESLSNGWRPGKQHFDILDAEAAQSVVWAAPHIILAVSSSMEQMLGSAINCLGAYR